MMKTNSIIYWTILLLAVPQRGFPQWTSLIATLQTDTSIVYSRDTEGNLIPDFSHAGFKSGCEDIPDVPVMMTISPVPGDNTSHIQAAINLMGNLTSDSMGIRGALLLDSGVYEIHGTILLNRSGVILRGVGDGADTSSNTILKGVGDVPHQRDLIKAGGGAGTSWSGKVAGTQTDITSPMVLVGERIFKVDNPAPYQAGDNIVIYHPCTQAWLDAIGGGGTGSDDPWAPGTQPLVFNRRIESIFESTITVDVPLYNHLDRSLAQSYIYKYDRAGILSNIGIENLRIDIETAGIPDEDHAWNAVKMIQIEDSWVRNCTFLHFGLSGVATQTATRITIEDCRAWDPVAEITGARMYNFNLLKASSQVLVKNCHARNGRHHYVSNGTSWVSGCVFLYCLSEAAYNASEGHRRWSMGLLYDNITETQVRNSGAILLGLYNRGNYGTSHGWSSAHSVAWNCNMATGKLLVQKPPTAQNYAIGCKGAINGVGPFPHPQGYIEGSNVSELRPSSLYEGQLFARKNELVLYQEQLVEPEWAIYPNPSGGTFFIDLPMNVSGAASVEIFDLNGRLMHQRSLVRQTKIDLASLPRGVYLLQLSMNGQTITKRILLH